MKPAFNFILTLLFIFHVGLGIENDGYQDVQVMFSKSNLTVKQALHELDKQPEISVVYNGNEEFLTIMLTFPEEAISVQAALDVIQEQAPVSIVYNNGHIIVKSRQLEKNYLLTGKIVDTATQEGLIAADVYISGTGRGTVTDINGNFSINLKPGNYEIVARYVGYSEKRMLVNVYADKQLDFQLSTKQHEIQEVNITGTLGDLEEISRGRPIEKIASKTINQLNTNDVNDALHGRINGVWTTKVSGAPGDHNKIRIRGISSIFGSTDPLYVVDGVIIPVVNFKTLGIADLNSHDIQNITVLKDASSTALYGYLGGNGVILIDTKKGGGETKFDFQVKQGFQWQNKRYPLMNSENFLAILDSSDSYFGTRFYFTDSANYIWELYPTYLDSLGNALGSTDFQDEIFQTGSISEAQLSAQGRLKKLDYFLSGNYYTHRGVLINSSYDKYSFTGNLSRVIGENLSLRLLYKGSYQENDNNLDNYLGNNVIYKGINYEPGYYFTPDSFFRKPDRLYLNNGYPYYGATVDELSNHVFSPGFLFEKQQKGKEVINNSASFQSIYRFNNQWSARALFSLYRQNLHFKSYYPDPRNVRFLSSNEEVSIISQQYDINYSKVKNYHKVSAFIRYRDHRDNVYWQVDSTRNVDIENLNPQDNIYIRSSSSIYGSKGSIIRRLKAGIAGINYNYRDKYNLSLIANYDFLREGNYVKRQGLFTSIAADWDLAKEAALHLPHWIDEFHLYANYGESGNYPLNSLSNELYNSAEYAVGNKLQSGAYISSLANHYLQHEEVTEYNLGTNINLMNESVLIKGDYYIKYNSNLLLQREIPNYYGGGFIFQNIGSMQNKGLEISLEVSPVMHKQFAWTSRFGFATNKQIITELYDSVSLNFNNVDLLYPDFHAEENEVLGSMYGYQIEGLWDEEIHSNEANGFTKFINEKGIAYLKTDTTDTTSLIVNDKVLIGNSIPDFTCNWINMIQYKNFTFEMHWYAVIGVDKYNVTKATTYIAGTNQVVRSLVLDSLNYFTSPAFYESSYFVEDASFIRLKTISVRYRPSRKIMGRISAEYSISFENLLTLTRYTGYDPEATIYTNNNFTDNAIDRGAYPNPRGVYISVNLSF